MASRFWTAFSQLKTKAGPRPSTREGVKTEEGPVSETTHAWPKPGPVSSFSHNRTMKSPVVKQYPTHHGMS